MRLLGILLQESMQTIINFWPNPITRLAYDVAKCTATHYLAPARNSEQYQLHSSSPLRSPGAGKSAARVGHWQGVISGKEAGVGRRKRE